MTEEEKKKKRKIFIARAIGFFAFGAGLPFAFIAWRYGLFTAKSGVQMSLGGWGIVAVAIVGIILIYMLRQVGKALPHSMLTQCMSGFVKVIVPLGLILIILNGVKDSLDYFIQALTAIIICEAIAIPMNPFPSLIEEKRKEEKETDRKSWLDGLKEIFKKEGE